MPPSFDSIVAAEPDLQFLDEIYRLDEGAGGPPPPPVLPPRPGGGGGLFPRWAQLIAAFVAGGIATNLLYYGPLVLAVGALLGLCAAVWWAVWRKWR